MTARSSCIPPPRPAEGRCTVCRASTHAGFALCYCCTELVRQLRLPLVPVVATAGFRPGDRLHRRLRGYKDAPTAEARAACADRLASMVGSWMADHPAHLRDRFGPGWEAVCPVPSSARPGTPVDALVARVPELARCGRALLVRGPAPTGHLRADRRGFELAGSVDPGWLAGRRVLVFDDAVVTGARAQSAAAALRSAGARVVGVLAAGRAAPR